MATALFVRLHNAGRSQMSAALFADPDGRVHPEVIEAMREIGIDLSDRRPQNLTHEIAQQADVVATMGCGDVCLPGPMRQSRDRLTLVPVFVPSERERGPCSDARSCMSPCRVLSGLSMIGSVPAVPAVPAVPDSTC